MNKVQFIGSYLSWKDIPQIGLPEIAFAGRSNVGKSSLINALAGTKLAYVSSTPGKTQTLNVYRWENKCLWVDLPGLGYAKVSKKTRFQWEKIIYDYLSYSSHLSHVFYLVDIVIPPQSLDGIIIQWLQKAKLPFMIVFTKKDKISSNQLVRNIETYDRWLRDHFEIDLPPHIAVSSLKKNNISEILDYIEQIVRQQI
ncbi:MAG: ribosome biogenesis GTP-binding protein YihA/YsxC [Bacteroidales bacterium]|nr:ribosome biogenesis GTP-binding protein YihA/YsxC [Bacteroidales bacterium]